MLRVVGLQGRQQEATTTGGGRIAVPMRRQLGRQYLGSTWETSVSVGALLQVHLR